MDFDSLDIRIDLDKISDFDSLENRNMESIRSRQLDFGSLEVQDTEVIMLHRQVLQSFLTSDLAKLSDFIARITLGPAQMNMRWRSGQSAFLTRHEERWDLKYGNWLS